MKKQTRTSHLATQRRKPTPGGRKTVPVHYAKEESTGFLIWDTARILNRMFRGKVSWPGLNNSHWPFIRELWEEDGISQKELADRAHLRAPTCLAAVRGLMKNGLVKRIPDKSDRRKINVFLTQKGRDMYRRVVPELKQIHSVAARGVSAQELEIIKTLLRRIRANLIDHSQ